jgi:copper chaperone NosL
MTTPSRPGWTLLLVAMTASLLACGQPVEPARLDTVNSQCRFCRMAVSDARFAAQIAAPGAEPLFFDDLGCLRDYLGAPGVALPDAAVAFVADHRTRGWVRAADALFTRPIDVRTPMGGGIIAHADADSRDQDAVALGGSPVPAAAIFGAAGVPNGGRP